MVILSYNVRVGFPTNILIREATYHTVSNHTVLPLHQINTVKNDMNIWKMVSIKNTPG